MLQRVSERTSTVPADPTALAAALEASGYLPDEGLATAAYLALVMHRPLFLEGEAGVGKTALARALAEVTGRPIYRLQCYEGLEASQALYDWDFGRQLLHLRAAEAAHATQDTAELEASLYDRRFNASWTSRVRFDVTMTIGGSSARNVPSSGTVIVKSERISSRNASNSSSARSTSSTSSTLGESSSAWSSGRASRKRRS